MGIRHATVVTKSDDPNDERLQGNHWNADHIMPAVPEPDNPSEDTSIIWMSNGYGVGDEGDIMCKITVNGISKYATIVDFSTASTVPSAAGAITDEDGFAILDENGNPITEE